MSTSINSSGVTFPDSTTQTTALRSNIVGADYLNVSGNGTSGQKLVSDGDGSFSWVDDAPVAIALDYTGVEDGKTVDIGITSITNQSSSIAIPNASVYKEVDGAVESYNGMKSQAFTSSDSTWVEGIEGDGVYHPGGCRKKPKIKTGINLSSMGATPTASFNINTGLTNSRLTDPQAFSIDKDGTTVFVAEGTGGKGGQFRLTRPWDFSTPQYAESEQGALTNTAATGTTSVYGYQWGYNLTNGTSYLYGVSSHWDSLVYAASNTPWHFKYNWAVIGLDTIQFQMDSEDSVRCVKIVEQTYNSTKFLGHNQTWFLVGGQTTDSIYQFKIDNSNPYYIANQSYPESGGRTLYHGSQTTTIQFVEMSADGTRLFVSGDTQETIYQYNLSTAYDISSGSYSQSKALGTSYGSTIRGIQLSPNNDRMYVLMNSGDRFNEYSFGNATSRSIGTVDFGFYSFNTDAWTRIRRLEVGVSRGHSWNHIQSDLTGREDMPVYFGFWLGGTHNAWFINHWLHGPRKIVRNNNGTWQYNTNTSGSPVYETVESKSLTATRSISVVDPNPDGVAINSTGTQMFTTSPSSDDVSIWNMSPAYTGTLSYAGRFKHHDSAPNGINMSPCGHYFAVENKVYYMENKDDIEDMIYIGTYGGAFPSLLPNGRGLIYSSADYISQSSMGKDYITSTSTVFDADKSDTSKGIALHPNGNHVFYNNSTRDQIYTFSLMNAYDITSAFDNKNHRSATGDTVPSGICISSDGHYFYEVGDTNDSIRIYTVNSSWTYGTGESWTNASSNNENTALQQALAYETNRMTNSDIRANNMWAGTPEANKGWDLFAPIGVTSGSKFGAFFRESTHNHSYFTEVAGIDITYTSTTMWKKVDCPTSYYSGVYGDRCVIEFNQGNGNYKVRID
jgi:hypothetical protein